MSEVGRLQAELIAAASNLYTASKLIEFWGSYASPYFRKKWALDEDIKIMLSAREMALKAARVSSDFSSDSEKRQPPEAVTD